MAFEDFARLQVMSIRKERVEQSLEFRTITVFRINLPSFFPKAAHVGGDRVAIFGKVNGRRHHFFQRQASESLMHGHPTANGAGDVDGFDAVGRDAFKTTFFELGDGSRFGQWPGTVDAIKLPLVPDEGETVGTESVAGWFDYRLSGSDGDCRVNGVAALEQNLKAGAGS